MGLLYILFKEPIYFFILTIPLLYSIIIHEVAHGWVAYAFGDDTAKRSGRLSLNPLTHLDLLGTIALFVAGFGWAKPVPINYSKFRNIKVGVIFLSLAGCAANILIATVSLMLLRIDALYNNEIVANIFYILARINIILGSFNLIPIPPLDGSRLLMVTLPERQRRLFISIEPYGMMILIYLLFSGLLTPVINLIQSIILFLIKILVGGFVG